MQTGQLEDAVVLFRQALVLRPSEPAIAGALSGLLIKRHEPQAAVDMCRTALAQTSASVPGGAVLWNFNVALRQLGRLDEAVATAWAALSAAVPGCSNPTTPPQTMQATSVSTGVGGAGTDGNMVFVCVKYGTKYGPEYVNHLCRAVAAWAPSAWRFVCLTEDAAGLDAAVDARPLPPPAPGAEGALAGWWAKGHLFEATAVAFGLAATAGPGRGPWVCYCDLDTVISGDLSFLDELCRAEDIADNEHHDAAEQHSEPFITLAAADLICEGTSGWH